MTDSNKSSELLKFEKHQLLSAMFILRKKTLEESNLHVDQEGLWVSKKCKTLHSRNIRSSQPRKKKKQTCT